jgi:hypothetical protein
LRAGIVGCPEHYRWSSFGGKAGLWEDRRLDLDPVTWRWARRSSKGGVATQHLWYKVSQALWSRSNDRAGNRGGARAGKRAGLVAHPWHYPWSSCRHYAHGESGLNGDWLTAHEAYLRLGRNERHKQSACRQLFQAAISGNDLAEIRDCTHKGWALGDERFREQIEALGQRRAASKGVDRPRKENNRV